jgi:monoterpene epsilon-lactone hydrolase
MTSPTPTDLLGEIYAQWLVEMIKYPDMSIELLRIIFDDWQRATAEPEGVTYRNTELGGVAGIMATPQDATEGEMLLLMHGGGFALGSSISHRKLGGHLAAACHAPVFVADFRLAPEHPYPAGVQDGLAIFDALIEQGYDAADVTPVGDSAGANLAVSLVLHLMASGRTLPDRVITMSPWLNMENSGATIETNDATDFLITREGLQSNIDRYLGGLADPKDPLVNPLYADLTGFPRLYICAADTESLFDDSVQFNALAEKCGVDVTFSVGAGMQHVFPILAGRHERADQEIAQIAQWYRASHRPV